MRLLITLLVLLPTAAFAVEPLAITTQGDLTICRPQGPLATLLSSPACRLDFDACESAGPTIAGSQRDSATWLALLARTDDRWTYACAGDGPKFLHQPALRALGYAGQSETLQPLVGLVAQAKALGENDRRLLAEALYWLDDPKAAQAMLDLLRVDAAWPDFKPIAVAALARWQHAGAVEWCSGHLGANARDDIAAACVHYLAAVKAPNALKQISAALAHHPRAAIRALGALGDKKGAAAARRFAGGASATELRVAAWVTLVQLGEEAYLGRLLRALRGPVKIRAERLKKAARRAKRRKKRKRRRRRYRRRKKKKRRAPSRRARRQLMTMLNQLDLAHHAAVELTRLTGTAHRDKIDRALRKAARAEFELRWKAHTYALLALAQRGDAKAIDAVLKRLPVATQPIRQAIVAVAGGRGWAFTESVEMYGAGLIADPRLGTAMLELAEDCDTHAQRAAALRAALLIRAATQGGN